MGATFINIELEVRASFDLSKLASEFGARFGVNYCGKVGRGKYLLSGAYYGNQKSGPDAIARGLCNLVAKLRPSVKQLWSRASDRVFDIGFNANLDRRVGLHVFEADTLAQIAKVGARIAVSTYTWDFEPQTKGKMQLTNRATRTRLKK